jgi:hypothetical protein
MTFQGRPSQLRCTPITPICHDLSFCHIYCSLFFPSILFSYYAQRLNVSYMTHEIVSINQLGYIYIYNKDL